MKYLGLKIEVKCNLKTVDYLDTTFNLNNGKHKPFNKPNNNPRYVHVQSNHPPNIIEEIPKSISKRISVNSHDEEVFKDAAPFYDNILNSCGYTDKLRYSPDTEPNDVDEPHVEYFFCEFRKKNGKSDFLLKKIDNQKKIVEIFEIFSIPFFFTKKSQIDRIFFDKS